MVTRVIIHHIDTSSVPIVGAQHGRIFIGVIAGLDDFLASTERAVSVEFCVRPSCAVPPHCFFARGSCVVALIIDQVVASAKYGVRHGVGIGGGEDVGVARGG